MTKDYTADLAAAQRNFAVRTKGLSPRVLRLQMLADINKGQGQIDPLERSFAQQSHELLSAQDGLARLELGA